MKLQYLTDNYGHKNGVFVSMTDWNKIQADLEQFRKLKKTKLHSDDKAEFESVKDFWFDLPNEVKNDIDIAIEEADNGKLISHSEAMKQIRAKLLKT